MNEYVIGCVADLISDKSASPIKTKKLKNKLNKNNEDQGTNDSNEIDKSVSEVLKIKKKKKKKKLNELSEKSIQVVEPSQKKVENPSQQVINKSRLKKRKKTNIKDQEVPLPKKTKYDVPDEDHVTSDSEKDEDEIIQKKSKERKKLTKNSEQNSLNENTVFIDNIPINYDKQKICKKFSKFGEIQNARIRCVPIADINMSKKVAAIKKSFNPKRNSLVAYVNFKSLESAEAAVKANGMLIDGHHLRIDFANDAKERDNNKAVFVGGLPFDIEDDELWEFFEKCGKINSVRIIRDSQTSMGKGFGYVNFDSTTSVELALQLNGQELKKRAINVKRCVNSRNKNKLNSFGKKKSKEIANELLCKRGKKFKEEKKKIKKERTSPIAFQGKTATVKQKKKKKLSKAALRQRKLVKILGMT